MRIPKILWNPPKYPPGLLLASGGWIMPSLVCSESKLLRAELGVLPMCPRLYTEHRRAQPPDRQFLPPAWTGRTGPHPGPWGPWPGWPHTWKQDRHSKRLEVWNTRDSSILGSRTL